MKRKVRALTRRNQGREWTEVRDSLRRAVVGWVNYYALAEAKNHIRRVLRFVRQIHNGP